MGVLMQIQKQLASPLQRATWPEELKAVAMMTLASHLPATALNQGLQPRRRDTFREAIETTAMGFLSSFLLMDLFFFFFFWRIRSEHVITWWVW